MIAGIGIMLGVFAGMEILSWAIHKYVMHGFLWGLHKSHHRPGSGFFEWNDLFPVLFGGIAIWLMFSGMKELSTSFWIGLGITFYGMTYFIVHDLMAHRRLKGVKPFNNRYFKAVVRAHKMHHKHLDRTGGESFGLLLVPLKYLRNKEFETER